MPIEFTTLNSAALGAVLEVANNTIARHISSRAVPALLQLGWISRPPASGDGADRVHRRISALPVAAPAREAPRRGAGGRAQLVADRRVHLRRCAGIEAVGVG